MGDFDNVEFDNVEGDDGVGKKKLMAGVLLLLVVAVGAAGGAIASSLVSDAPSPPDAEPQADQPGRQEEGEKPSGQDDQGQLEEKYYYFEGFEPVTVSLNERRVDRYLRAAIILKIDRDDYRLASQLISSRQRELTDWMIRYLSGLSLNEVRGQRNINRIRREIKDAFNEELWPKSRPRIQDVLLKEFAVQ